MLDRVDVGVPPSSVVHGLGNEIELTDEPRGRPNGCGPRSSRWVGVGVGVGVASAAASSSSSSESRRVRCESSSEGGKGRESERIKEFVRVSCRELERTRERDREESSSLPPWESDAAHVGQNQDSASGGSEDSPTQGRW